MFFFFIQNQNLYDKDTRCFNYMFHDTKIIKGIMSFSNFILETFLYIFSSNKKDVSVYYFLGEDTKIKFKYLK